jgi:hypothetical protein
LHSGQREPGKTIDSSAGIRRMQTFAKEPMIAPKRKRIGVRGNTAGKDV